MLENKVPKFSFQQKPKVQQLRHLKVDVYPTSFKVSMDWTAQSMEYSGKWSPDSMTLTEIYQHFWDTTTLKYSMYDMLPTFTPLNYPNVGYLQGTNIFHLRKRKIIFKKSGSLGKIYISNIWPPHFWDTTLVLVASVALNPRNNDAWRKVWRHLFMANISGCTKSTSQILEVTENRGIVVVDVDPLGEKEMWPNVKGDEMSFFFFGEKQLLKISKLPP